MRDFRSKPSRRFFARLEPRTWRAPNRLPFLISSPASSVPLPQYRFALGFGTWVLVERLQRYFLTYKLVPGQPVHAQTSKVYGRAHALKVVQSAMADYEAKFGG